MPTASSSAPTGSAAAASGGRLRGDRGRRQRQGRAPLQPGHPLDRHRGALDRGGQGNQRLVRGDQDVQLDGRRVGPLPARQVGEDLAHRLDPVLDLLDAPVDRHQVELPGQPVDVGAGADVLAQPVLLVLGEHAEQARVELPAAEAVVLLRPGRRRSGRGRVQPAQVVGQPGRVQIAALARRGQRSAEQLDRLEQEIDGGRPRIDPPQPDGVEQVLQPVSQLGGAGQAEQPAQPLERVDGAEAAVDEIRIGRPRRPLAVELEQVALQRLDDLLGLGEELAQRPVVAGGHYPACRCRRTAASNASAVNGLTRYSVAPRAMARSRSASAASVVMMMSGVSR